MQRPAFWRRLMGEINHRERRSQAIRSDAEAAMTEAQETRAVIREARRQRALLESYRAADATLPGRLR